MSYVYTVAYVCFDCCSDKIIVMYAIYTVIYHKIIVYCFDLNRSFSSNSYRDVSWLINNRPTNIMNTCYASFIQRKLGLVYFTPIQKSK